MLNAWLKCVTGSVHGFFFFFLLQLKVMLLNQKAGHRRQIPAATPIPPPSLSGSRSLHGSRRRKMKQRKKHLRAVPSARPLGRGWHVVSHRANALSRRPLRLEEKHVLVFLGSQDELPVGHERCHSFVGNRDMPKNTPLARALGLHDDNLVNFSWAASQDPVDTGSRPSRAQLCSTITMRTAKTEQS